MTTPTDSSTRRLLVCAALVLGLTGCAVTPSQPPTKPEAAPHPQAAPALPPRPSELRLDGIRPCALLTEAQISQLGMAEGRPGINDQGAGEECIWSNPPGTGPDMGWLARTDTARGAEYALRSVTGAHIIQIDGFSAVETTSPLVDSRWSCIVLVDVALGQSFLVQFQNSGGTDPLMTHERACAQATRGASLMLQNLRSRSR
ncbi:DUF3558 domain-containing protein [Pseudonocardia eucalypti]|uniref:DUF3558 domain-containing protein n=1 Tax=Pseudonocardia eucalypti TaxID=648755 RepID=UPI0016115FD0